MRNARLCTTVSVFTRSGAAKGYGALESLTQDDALMVVSAPLKVGDTYRYLLIDHTSGMVTHRFGKVLSTRYAFNDDEELPAECRVQWLNPSEIEGVAQAEAS
jgi:hypothetical protein